MSNGSESTPERCVHAVDGPDWAGLREPTSWKERAIAAEAENTRLTERLESSYETSDRYNARIGEVLEQAKINEARLLAERDALLAENAQLRGDLSENRRALDDAINVANGNKTARDALQAENEKHRADLHEWETVGAPAWVAAKDAQIAEVWAGRDALQARLDAMTVEWGKRYDDWADGGPTHVHRCTEVQAREHKPDGHRADGSPYWNYELVSRLVGPWTVVPEGEQP